MTSSRFLGRTGLRVSKVGFGCTGFWARSLFPESSAIALLEKAIDSGINLVDTGPSYGEGLGERRLGKVLLSLPLSRRPIVSTKAGTHFDSSGRHYRDFSPQAVRDSVYASLERLRLQSVDLLHLHGPLLDDLRPDLIETLADIRNSGLVRHLGINTTEPAVAEFALAVGIFDSFMVEYNILRKFRLRLLDTLGNAGAGVIAITPTARSLFRRSMRPRNMKALWEFGRALRFHRDDLLAARRYDFLNSVPDMTATQAALAFVLAVPHVSSAVFATTSVDHLALNIEAAKIEPPLNLLEKMQSLPDGRGAGPIELGSFATAALSMLLRSRAI
jgi:1-deoxyxylulose-5-phosphate synthase